MHQLLKHFFLPHHTNNHRARVLHPDMLLCYVLFFAIVNLSIRVFHQEFPTVLGYATDIRVEQLLSLTNQKRKALGLTELSLNEKLSQAAYKKAQDMFSYNYWAHNSPQGKTPWVFILDSGYSYLMAGENLAKNFSTSGGVVDAWMASPTHKDNIVKPGYRDIGFAIVNGVLSGEETTLVVQMFGSTGEKAMNSEKKKTLNSSDVDVRALGEAVGEEIKNFPVGEKSQEPFSAFMSGLSSVVAYPKINIPTVTRDVAFIFLGVLIGILILDGVLAKKNKIFRITGQTVAHVIFLVSICIILMLTKRGMLL